MVAPVPTAPSATLLRSEGVPSPEVVRKLGAGVGWVWRRGQCAQLMGV